MADDGPIEPEKTPPVDPMAPDPRASTDALPELPPPPTTAPPDAALADTMAGDSDRVARALSGDSDPFARTMGSAEFGPATVEGMRVLNYTVGETISGRYEISGVLGQGGFAVVYAARDRVVDRQVAVKVLNTFADAVDETNTQRAVDRFEREARAAAMITHPNVVTIFDLGVADRFGRPYIVMELLEGHDLAHELKTNGAMAPERALRLFSGALAGLAAGHARGIVHKDLKPANLFLTGLGTPDEKLSLFDFGIARLGAGESGLTKTGEMFGTPQYMAPEYIAAGQVSPALDVYQMGLILVEMFTGRKVVEADVAITAAMTHGKGELPLPIELLEGPLGGVVLGALAHDRAVRFQDAGAFAEALDAALVGVDISALTPPDSGTTRLLIEAADPTTGRLRPETVQTLRPELDRGASRRRAALAVAALAALAVGGWWLTRGGPDGAPLPPPPPREATLSAPGALDAGAVPHVTPVADATPAAPDAAVDATADAEPPPPVEIRLAIQPAGARVTVDGAPVADGVLRFAGPEAPPQTVVVSRAGFVSTTRAVKPGDGPRVDIRLDAAPAARPPAPEPPVAVEVPPPKITVIPPPPEPEPDPEPPPLPDPEPESGAVILD